MRPFRPSEEEVFEQVLGCRSKEEQIQRLRELCGSDVAMQLRVESLLAAYPLGDFLEREPVSDWSVVKSQWMGTDSVIGRYRLVKRIGEGSVGEVYLAVDATASLQQVVIKLFKRTTISRDDLSSFERENRVLEKLHHPNVVRLIESGFTDEGRAFIVMELASGFPITEFCEHFQLSIEERVRLMMDVAQAVHEVHQAGIIHRDLKPSHILVDVAEHQTKITIIDFGIARFFDSTEATSLNSSLVGTLNYSSPEQLMRLPNIDVRTDVYSLGAILYQLLTGTAPTRFTAVSFMSLVENSERRSWREPENPSDRIHVLGDARRQEFCRAVGGTSEQLVAGLRKGLDWIAIKALQTDMKLRYSSAFAFKADLDAYLHGLPVAASSMRFRTRIWLRRNYHLCTRLLLVCAAAVLLFLVWRLGQEVSVSRNSAQAELKSRAVDNRDARAALALRIQKASETLWIGDTHDTDRILSGLITNENTDWPLNFAVDYLQNCIPRSVAPSFQHADGLLDMDMSSDQLWIASGHRDGSIILRNLQSGETRRLYPEPGKEVTRLRFSPDSGFLASTGQDQKIRIWNVRSGLQQLELSKHDLTINGLSWAPDGKQLASGDRQGKVFIWDIEQRQVVQRLPVHSGHVRCLAWSPDGRYLATADYNSGLLLWDTETWQQIASLPSNHTGVLAISFSADSHFVAFGGYNNLLTIYDLKQMAESDRMDLGSGNIWDLAFGIRNELFVGTGGGRLSYFQCRLNRLGQETWNRIRVFPYENDETSARRVFYSRSRDSVTIASEETGRIFSHSGSQIRGFESDERLNAARTRVISKVGALIYDDPERPQSLIAVDDRVHSMPLKFSALCSPQCSNFENNILIAGEDAIGQCVLLVDMDDWQVSRRIAVDAPATSLSLSADGQQVAVCERSVDGEAYRLRVYDVPRQQWTELDQFAAPHENKAQFSATMPLLAIGNRYSRSVEVMNSTTWQIEHRIGLGESFQCLYFCPLSGALVVAERNRLSWWSMATGELVSSQPTADPIVHFEPSADGKAFATISNSGRIQLWDASTRVALLSLPVAGSQNADARMSTWVGFLDSATIVVGDPTLNCVRIFCTEPTPHTFP